MYLAQMSANSIQAMLVANKDAGFFPLNLTDYPLPSYPQGIPRAVLVAQYLLLCGAAAGIPTLGAASQYAILAQAGITNTGNTVILNGSIGSYPTPSITGFPPGVATIDNLDAQAAVAAAQVAYLAYQALPFTSISSSTADLTALGNGATASTWLAGNYSAGSSMSMATSITLDAQGNANALFVFKAGSTVNLSAGASVLLVNGAQASNVIWIVGSSLTTVATSTMVGTILANTSVTLGGGVLNGRAFAGMVAPSGAVTISAAELVTVPAGSAGGVGVCSPMYAPGIYNRAAASVEGDQISQEQISVPAGLQPNPQVVMPIAVSPQTVPNATDDHYVFEPQQVS
jgi:type VI secretion system secreted protein VgrG